MQILIVGDIVGSPGRTAFARIVGQMKAAGKVDFVVVNAENAAGGRGITPKLADELFGAGCRCDYHGGSCVGSETAHSSYSQRYTYSASFEYAFLIVPGEDMYRSRRLMGW